MKRYMICPITGSGTMNDPYRATVQDVSGVNSTTLIPSDPNDGTPLYGFAFCRVSATNFAPVIAVTNSYVFPDFPLDSQMGSMAANTRAAMVQSVEAYDLDGQGLNLVADHDDADAYRDVIAQIAQQFEPAFNADHFDVSEAS